MGQSPGAVPRVVLQDGQRRRWLCFGEPIRVLRAESTDQVLAALHEAEQAVEAEGLYAAGFVAYEAAPGFDPALKVREQPDLPLLWLGLFHAPEVWSDLPGTALAHTLGTWEPAIDRATYRQAIAAIKEQIAAGYTYQINYTFPLGAAFNGEPWPLFTTTGLGPTRSLCRLRRHGPSRRLLGLAGAVFPEGRRCVDLTPDEGHRAARSNVCGG